MDDGTLGQFVDDGDHLGQSLGSSVLVLKGAEITQCIAHGLGVLTILDSSFFVGTNSFFCRLVMCHNYYFTLSCTPSGIRTRDFENENLTSWAS